MVKELEDFYTLVDSMVLCKFVSLPTIGPILWEELTRLYSIVTGVRVKKRGLVKLATRINNIVRSFNVREGIDKTDDTLPERFTKERVEGQIVEKEKLETMANDYYRMVGPAGFEPTTFTRNSSSRSYGFLHRSRISSSRRSQQTREFCSGAPNG